MRLVTPLIALALGGLLVGATLLVQEQESMEMPKPAAEHALLKRFVGNWKADFKSAFGNHVGRLEVHMLGDFWAVGDYTGELIGQPFKGHELFGYDPDTKQYTTYWYDGSSPQMSALTGTYDEASKTMTQTSMEFGMDGQKHKVTHKTVWSGDDTMTYTYAMEGMPEPMMTITYTRQK